MTMRAVGCTRFGGPEALHIVDLPVPEPADGEVRIKVAAATVNPSDAAFRAGGLWPGERVFAIVLPYLTGRGAQAE
jgi:NADPH:quinone reductase